MDTSSGTYFELVFQAILTLHGYEYYPNKVDLFANRKDKSRFPGKHYGKEVIVGKSSKGTNRRVEFFIINHARFGLEGLIAECKWQQVNGSLGDKLYRIPADVKKTAIPTIAVIDGPALEPGIREMLKGHVDGYIFIACWSTMELISQAIKGFWGEGYCPPAQKDKESINYPYGDLWEVTS